MGHFIAFVLMVLINSPSIFGGFLIAKGYIPFGIITVLFGIVMQFVIGKALEDA